jgi:hypothetical protein
MLDRATAQKYATAWAKKVGANTGDLKEAGGDFFGLLGSLGFEYLAKEQRLAVRGYVFAYSTAFNSKADLLPWLNQIAAEQPASVSNGLFESLTPRWEPEKEPSLFLRIDFKDGSMSDSAAVSRLLKFRDDVVLWDRSKLTEALDGLVKHRRQLKKL